MQIINGKSFHEKHFSLLKLSRDIFIFFQLRYHRQLIMNQVEFQLNRKPSTMIFISVFRSALFMLCLVSEQRPTYSCLCSLNPLLPSHPSRHHHSNYAILMTIKLLIRNKKVLDVTIVASQLLSDVSFWLRLRFDDTMKWRPGESSQMWLQIGFLSSSLVFYNIRVSAWCGIKFHVHQIDVHKHVTKFHRH